MGRFGQILHRNLEDFAGIASDWFWETDENHRFTYLSDRMEQVTGVRADGVIGRRRDELQSKANEVSCIARHLDDLANRRPFRDYEYRIQRDIGSGVMWLQVSGDPVFAPDGRFVGYRGSGRDITEEREMMQKLEEANATLAARNRELDRLRRELELAAYEDPLTGLRNRRAFDAAIAKALEARSGNVALLHIDLDEFKEVNDTYGHLAGDMVLVNAAARIVEQCDIENEVFRVGGDEFMVIIADCRNTSQARKIGEKIVAEMARPIRFETHEIRIGASVGVATSNGVPTSPHRLIARSDRALYAAKGEGRGQVRSASP